MKRNAKAIFAAGLVWAAYVWSQPTGPGPGMMGGGGGYGPGPGMMGGYGMGPGMMGGYGMGPGMMRGYGPGNTGPYSIPNLTDEQRTKINDIEKEYRQKQWQVMEKMHDLNFQSQGLYRNGKFDEEAARKSYDAMAALRKQMFENSLEERKRVDALLTPQQREQLSNAWGGQ